MWIRQNGVGITLARKLSPSKRGMQDMRFYYQYHRDYGHETDVCRDLRWEIEQLIKNGKLGRFTKNFRKDRDSNDHVGNRPN